MAGGNDLAKMVPGFEFLQNLMQGAGTAFPGVPGMPGMNQWIAPTLDPAELDKRIQELKTVQFWLEQNARLLATTVQALEVQRMTLSTLQTMNLPMADLRNALKINLPAAPAAAADAPAPAAAPKKAAPAKSPADAAPPAIDPMQWWGALTKQFTELAAKAVKDGAAEASKGLATLKPAAAAVGSAAKAAVSPARAAVARASAARKRGA